MSDLRICAEAVIHDDLNHLLFEFAEKYGIQVNRVIVDWSIYRGMPSDIIKLEIESERCPRRER
jgi:hypothetical protein